MHIVWMQMTHVEVNIFKDRLGNALFNDNKEISCQTESQGSAQKQ